ncbi:PDT-domain-containing protein [Bimuria novae-zelandiae CBS 107.79]|uniref:prephenate dehydratase n=1 Tax=Bimuria novae-zelandiae CBS 107.79 TaxID=1447943 RepID=A0A6A5V718_9PLEO|nr:PDT-domain-containing protein [Bimuria novae-zelandiae CBS 107.79]
MSEGLKLQDKPVVSFLGPKASYTHQATLGAFNEQDFTLNPVITIEDVFASVQKGTAYRGVVPFENSSNGSVVFTLDLFADLQQKYPDIIVCGESYIAVQHCLLGHHSDRDTQPPLSLSGTSSGPGVIESPMSSGAVTPTTKEPVPQKPTARPVGDLSRIKKLYSHPQAWGQCKVFLNTYLKSVEKQDVSSTSRAAQLVAEDDSGESAAVSSIIAARILGLDLLAKGIEDRGDNTTRFFVLKKAPSSSTSASATVEPTSSTAAASKGKADEQAGTGDWKTLVSFTVDHANPGSLAQSLAVFAKYGLNLTSINTRPSGVENWNYIFFVELKGKKEEDTEDGPVNQALKDLDSVCRAWRWLGSWENRLVR